MTEVRPSEYLSHQTDWFSTLQRTRDRLYNPRLHTAYSKEVQRKLPALLAQEQELLKTMVGSKEVSVHLHGTILIGLGTKGEGAGEKGVRPSDVDVVIFTGPYDEYEKRYQQQFAKINDQTLQALPGQWRDDDSRMIAFRQASNIVNRLDKHLDGMIFQVPKLQEQVEKLCLKLYQGAKPGAEKRQTAYNTMLLFASEPFFQSQKDLIGKFRNQMLKVIFNTPGGEVLWDQGIRFQFNHFLVNYERHPLADHPSLIEKRRKRVSFALDEILIQVTDSKKRQRVESFLRRQRSLVQLPTFKELEAVKDQINSSVT